MEDRNHIMCYIFYIIIIIWQANFRFQLFKRIHAF